MEPNTPVDTHLALPQLWGWSIEQVNALTVPATITTAIVTAVLFSIIGPFSRKWRLSLIILASGAVIEVFPIIILAFRLDGTLAQAITESIRIWMISLPLVLPVSAVAWFARMVWDDLGVAFEIVLSRWGLRGAIAMICVILAVFLFVTLIKSLARV